MWQLFRLGTTYFIRKVGGRGAAKALKDGAEKVGRASSRSDANKKLASQTAKVTSESTKEVVKRTGPTTPWRVLENGKHVFKPLDKAVRNKLSAPMRKRYDKALKTYNDRMGRTTAERTMRNRGRGPVGQAYGVGRATAQRLGSGSATSGVARVAKVGLTASGYGWVAGMAVDAAIRQTPWFKKWRKENPDAPESEATPGGKKKTTAPKTQPQTRTQPQTKTQPPAPPATPEEKHKAAIKKHGKHSKQAGRAWGAKHGIDISYSMAYFLSLIIPR